MPIFMTNCSSFLMCLHGDVCKIISDLRKERDSHIEYESERLDHLSYGLEKFCDELTLFGPGFFTI